MPGVRARFRLMLRVGVRFGIGVVVTFRSWVVAGSLSGLGLDVWLRLV